MTRQGALLTLTADVDNDGTDETGEFDLSTGIEITPGIRTGDLIGQAGSNAGAIIDYVAPGSGGRAGFNLDIGGGAATYEISFRGYEGNNDPWGDGSADNQADASGEGVFRQMSVLHRYLNQGTFDSTSSATLEWGDYDSGASAAYSAIDVTPEEPRTTFDADAESSVFGGTITLVATRAIADAATPSEQQNSR